MTHSARLVITPVNGFRQLSTFIRLPRRLYAGMEGYMPPLDMEQRTLLDPSRSPFYRHGEGQYFLAWKDGRPVGRISAQVEHLLTDVSAATGLTPNMGFFGALDAASPDVVAPLLEAAADWLRARGKTSMLGPWTLNSNGEYGTMIEGQNALPMIMMPWHPTFLAPAIEAAGLEKKMDVLSYLMEMGPEAEAAHVVPNGLKVGQGRLGTLSVRRLNSKQTVRDGEILRTLYNDTWRDTWGFVPYTDDEMKAMIHEIRPILREEHFVLVEQNGEPAGVALVVPNVFDVAGDLGGAPSPLGWAKLGLRLLRHDFHSARVILLGVSKGLAGTALGAILPALLISELMNRGHELPYSQIELGWVLETNQPMRRLIERIVPTPTKRHRVFSRSL
ncbi:GNAT family N-acetyltransferase [Acetobacter sp.]|uniref:GNAT family N-acetyltransferase n=1 Tax=Acetobacter sp. TaxID=440 RepID=UPI0039E763F5